MGARIRTIKPEFWGDEKVGKLSRAARLTFLGLISVASDDEGRCRGNPRGVRSMIYPLDAEVSVEEIGEHLEQIAAAGLITPYCVNGEPYIHIVNFNRHQRINRPTPSQLPPPPNTLPTTGELTAISVSPHGGLIEDSTNLPGVLTAKALNNQPVGESSVKEEQRHFPPAAVNKTERISVNGTDSSNPFPKDRCDRLYEIWLSTGHSVDYGRFRKALKPLFPNSGARYEEPAIAAAIIAFNEAADAASPEKSQFWHVNKFADDVGRWVRLGQMPLIDANGPTERGRIAAGLQ